MKYLAFLEAHAVKSFFGQYWIFASAVTNQVVIGYMFAVIYYALNIGGGKYLENFALFQMMKENTEHGCIGFWEQQCCLS